MSNLGIVKLIVESDIEYIKNYRVRGRVKKVSVLEK